MKEKYQICFVIQPLQNPSFCSSTNKVPYAEYEHKQIMWNKTAKRSDHLVTVVINVVDPE
jgi:hypothetical protein